MQSIIWHLSSSSIKKLFLLLCHQQATTQDKNYLICRKSEMLQETPLCLTELSIDIRLTSQTKSRTQDKACLLSTGSTQSFFNTFALSCRRRQGYSPVTHELWLSHHIWKALCWWGGVLQHSACHIRQHYLKQTHWVQFDWSSFYRGKQIQIHFLFWLKVTRTNKKDDR